MAETRMIGPIIHIWTGEWYEVPRLRDVPPAYDPKENARNVARLFMEYMPGNTNDIIFNAIENEIRELIKYQSPEKVVEILSKEHDVSNRIRMALDKLIREGEL